MKKQIIIVGFVVLVVAVVFAGCFEEDSGNGDSGNGGNDVVEESKFYGEWIEQGTGDSYFIYSNGTYNSSRELDVWYNWEIRNNELCISYVEFVEIEGYCVRFEFTNNDLKWILDGKTTSMMTSDKDGIICNITFDENNLPIVTENIFDSNMMHSNITVKSSIVRCCNDSKKLRDKITNWLKVDAFHDRDLSLGESNNVSYLMLIDIGD